MGRRILGFTLIGLGAVSVVVGAVLLFGGGEDPEPPPAAASTEATSMVTPTTRASTTTELATTTASLDSTTTTPAPAATQPPSTAPPVGPAEVAAFIVEFAAATEAGEAEFLFDRIHPVAIAASDAEVCREFVGREIVLIEDYRAAGPVTETARSFTVGDGTVQVDPLFEVPVTFTFQGQKFPGTAMFAPVDGVVHWFTECR